MGQTWIAAGEPNVRWKRFPRRCAKPTWAFEREMLEVKTEDLKSPVIRKLSAATDALAAVLVEAEGFRGAR
jgi:hypothetical protein